MFNFLRHQGWIWMQHVATNSVVNKKNQAVKNLRICFFNTETEKGRAKMWLCSTIGPQSELADLVAKILILYMYLKMRFPKLCVFHAKTGKLLANVTKLTINDSRYGPVAIFLTEEDNKVWAGRETLTVPDFIHTQFCSHVIISGFISHSPSHVYYLVIKSIEQLS